MEIFLKWKVLFELSGFFFFFVFQVDELKQWDQLQKEKIETFQVNRKKKRIPKKEISSFFEKISKNSLKGIFFREKKMRNN